LFGGDSADRWGQASLSPTKITVSMLFVGGLAAVTLANQFGYDGSAYAAHLIAGVPGRTELRSRVIAFSVYAVPLITGAGTAVALVVGRPDYLPAMLGALYAAYGAGLAINTLVSVLGAYALPETSNPFAVNTGSGMAKGLLSMVAIVGSVVAALPFAVAAALLGTIWLWLALPAGLAYGFGAAALGCYIGGDVLDRRGPALLSAVTPRP
jgi:ABC-2 type transport system permease protein